MDTSVRPGDDFYLYANGTWEKNTQIRPDRAFESPASDLYDQHEQKLQDLIEEAAKAQDPNSRRIAGLLSLLHGRIRHRSRRPQAA